jgi:hypothetical protein
LTGWNDVCCTRAEALVSQQQCCKSFRPPHNTRSHVLTQSQLGRPAVHSLWNVLTTDLIS